MGIKRCYVIKTYPPELFEWSMINSCLKGKEIRNFKRTKKKGGKQLR